MHAPFESTDLVWQKKVVQSTWRGYARIMVFQTQNREMCLNRGVLFGRRCNEAAGPGHVRNGDLKGCHCTRDFDSEMCQGSSQVKIAKIEGYLASTLQLQHQVSVTQTPPHHTTGAVQVVLVVAQNLHMSPGKLAAQCAHAAVGLYKLMARQRIPWLAAWEVGAYFRVAAGTC